MLNPLSIQCPNIYGETVLRDHGLPGEERENILNSNCLSSCSCPSNLFIVPYVKCGLAEVAHSSIIACSPDFSIRESALVPSTPINLRSVIQPASRGSIRIRWNNCTQRFFQFGLV